MRQYGSMGMRSRLLLQVLRLVRLFIYLFGGSSPPSQLVVTCGFQGGGIFGLSYSLYWYFRVSTMFG